MCLTAWIVYPFFFPIQQRAPLRSFSRSRSSRCKVEYSPSHEDLTTGININFRQREKTIPFRPVRQRRLLVQQPVVREEMLWWKMRIWVMCVPCASYSDVTRTQVLAMMFFSLLPPLESKPRLRHGLSWPGFRPGQWREPILWLHHKTDDLMRAEKWGHDMAS